jgi:hypothetical protein
MVPQIEFRIPIAPTISFYNRVHFFCAALRRLGRGYADALVRIVVGDYADLDEVRRTNAWATEYNLQWHRVPDEVSAAHHYYGTSDFRYALPESTADLVVLADADTALIQPVGQIFPGCCATSRASPDTWHIYRRHRNFSKDLT